MSFVAILNALFRWKSDRVGSTSVFTFRFLGLLLFRKFENELLRAYRLLCCSKVSTKCSTVDSRDLMDECRRRATILVFDAALGGGADMYFRRFKDVELEERNVLRVQYVRQAKCYVFSLFAGLKQSPRVLVVKNLNELLHFIPQLHLDQIVVNSLVSWRKLKDVLGLLSQISKNGVKIVFCLHDYYSFCPAINLLKQDRFCSVSTADCFNCPAAGDRKILDWRWMWGQFLSLDVSEILVFSHSSKKLLLEAYPDLHIKIKLKPHYVPSLRKCFIEPHTGINIAVVGRINNAAKGRDFLNSLEKVIATHAEVNLIVIGTYNKVDAATVVVGNYDRDELPQLLEKYRADIILIPSVCPETFSYTTSEAMLMGLPVACFDLGAQAERVSEYAEGLILKSFEPDVVLREIVDFVKVQSE